MSHYDLETKCLHSGYTPKKGEPCALPIYQSTTFKYDTTDEMGQLFDLKAEGYFYTRLQNPTNDAVAAKIADLEGGVAGLLTSSGQAANFYAIFNICEAGDHVVAASTIYGGTFNLLGVTLKKLGIDCTFVDTDASAEEIAAAFKPNTKVLFAETIANPALVILDIEKFAKVAHEHEVPLIVDNTFATPINCRPFEWGADIVTHSTTKYMDGHAVQVGGAIIDSGNFDWDAYGHKYHGLTEPDESYHGVVYTKQFGKKAYITKATTQLMRDLGSIPSPENCFLLNLGLETLPLRVERHCENAQKVAEFLDAHEKVSHVIYAGLPDDKYHELAQKYMDEGRTCGVISFELTGGRDAAVRFMDSLKLANIATHVAASKTMVLHPASHTHRQMNDEQLREAGVSYKVYKNTLMNFAFKGTDFEALAPVLEGPNAIAISKEDATAPARILAKFAKTAPALEIKAGVVEGDYYDAAGMQTIASVPSRQDLLSKLLGSIQSPITNFARVINQIAEQGGAANCEPAAAEETAEEAPAAEEPPAE